MARPSQSVERDPEAVPPREAAAWIVRVLRDEGHIANFAGGCVRDELLGLHPLDYDVATSARPDDIQKIFPRASQVGAAFGVMIVRKHGVTVEVATFRADGPYSDKRRPDSITFADEAADARRRDFTINALFLDPFKPADDPTRVIDHVGGVADLQARIVRAVGDPNARLDEDHLRALRAVRFATRLGFEIENVTAAAIRAHANQLRGVSRERIGDEVRLMLARSTRAASMRCLSELTLDVPVFERPADPDSPGARGDYPTLSQVADPLDVAAALAGALLDRWSSDLLAATPKGEGARLDALRVTRQALCLSNEERDDCLQTLSALAAMKHRWSDLAVAARKRLAAGARFSAAIALLGGIQPDLALAISADVRELSGHFGGLSPTPFINGETLIAAGLRPGPRFKVLLDQVYDAQLEGRVREPSSALALAMELDRASGV
ncbi:MAG: CCA tRNA nucleotidyltransferase [Phycisphaerales bacterium]|nr:CCA tRNA nucleotidyltransferase [Phycisphaerales bacterium]